MAMATKERLPPSGRDFAVYELITVQQKTTREVAAAAEVSQTRVCQIVRRVGEFLTEVTPPAKEGEKERQIRVGEQIAAERVQYLYGLAVRSFERSQGNQRTERKSALGPMDKGTVVTLRSSCGDTRYLAAAGRLALLAMKLPAPNLAGLLSGYEAEEEVREAAPAQGPLARDCSKPAAEQGSPAATSTEADRATSSPAAACEANPSEAWTDLRIALPTVQLPVGRGVSDQTQQHEGQPLSKRDRKARQKLLEQKMRRSREAG
jgi:hypothetical protein